MIIIKWTGTCEPQVSPFTCLPYPLVFLYFSFSFRPSCFSLFLILFSPVLFFSISHSLFARLVFFYFSFSFRPSCFSRYRTVNFYSHNLLLSRFLHGHCGRIHFPPPLLHFIFVFYFSIADNFVDLYDAAASSFTGFILFVVVVLSRSFSFSSPRWFAG